MSLLLLRSEGKKGPIMRTGRRAGLPVAGRAVRGGTGRAGDVCCRTRRDGRHGRNASGEAKKGARRDMVKSVSGMCFEGQDDLAAVCGDGLGGSSLKGWLDVEPVTGLDACGGDCGSLAVEEK